MSSFQYQLLISEKCLKSCVIPVKLICFDKGVYYIPRQSRLKGGVPLGADVDCKSKIYL